MQITVESPAFSANQAIPRKYTGEGGDITPPLRWSNVPAGAKELVLICDDPDAPRADPWVHWVLYGLDPKTKELPEGLPRKDRIDKPIHATQGRNSWGRIGYNGPMPPRGHGVHHYHFRVYALDKRLEAKPGLDKKELLALMRGHILAQGETVGTYQR